MKTFITVLLFLMLIGAAVWFYRPEHAYNRAHTIRDYRLVVEKFPGTTAAMRAEARIEELRFSGAVESGEPAELLAFEQDYPSSKFLAELPRTPYGYARPGREVRKVAWTAPLHTASVSFLKGQLLDEAQKPLEPPPERLTRWRYPAVDRFYLAVPLAGGRGEAPIGPAEATLTAAGGLEAPARYILWKDRLIETQKVRFENGVVNTLELVFEVPVGIRDVRLRTRGGRPVEIRLPFADEQARQMAAGARLWRGEWIEKQDLTRSGFVEADGKLVPEVSLKVSGHDVMDGRVCRTADLLREGWIYKSGRWLKPDEAARLYPGRYEGRWCTEDFARAADGQIRIGEKWEPEAALLTQGRLVKVYLRRARETGVEAIQVGQDAVNQVFALLNQAGGTEEWKVPKSLLGSVEPAGRDIQENLAKLASSNVPADLMSTARWWRTKGARWPNAAVHERACRLRAGKLLSAGRQAPPDEPPVDYADAAYRLADDPLVFVSSPLALGTDDPAPWDGVRVFAGTQAGAVNPGASLDYIVGRYGPPQEFRRVCIAPFGMLDYYRYDRLWLAVNDFNDVIAADVASVPLTLRFERTGTRDLPLDRPWMAHQGDSGPRAQPVSELVFSADERSLAARIGENMTGVRLIGGGQQIQVSLSDVSRMCLGRRGGLLVWIGRQVGLAWAAGQRMGSRGPFAYTETRSFDPPEGDTNITACSAEEEPRTVLLGTATGSVYVYEPDQSDKPTAAVRSREKAAVQAVALSPDRRWLAFATPEGLNLSELVPPGRKVVFRGANLTITALRFSPDGRYVLMLGKQGTAAFDTAMGRGILGAQFPAGAGAVMCAAVLPDLNYVALMQGEGGVSIVVSDPRIMAYTLPVGINPAEMTAYAMSPEGRFLACGAIRERWWTWSLQPLFMPYNPPDDAKPATGG